MSPHVAANQYFLGILLWNGNYKWEMKWEEGAVENVREIIWGAGPKKIFTTIVPWRHWHRNSEFGFPVDTNEWCYHPYAETAFHRFRCRGLESRWIISFLLRVLVLHLDNSRMRWIKMFTTRTWKTSGLCWIILNFAIYSAVSGLRTFLLCLC